MAKHERSKDWRKGYNAGWRNEPMPSNASADMRNGWHVGRVRLVRATAEVLGVEVVHYG